MSCLLSALLMCGLMTGGMSVWVFADDFNVYESYDEFEEHGYGFIYNTDKVKLESMPVYEAGTTDKITKPIVFNFYNTTKQEYEFSLTSQEGMLPEAELIVDHEYMVTIDDDDYAMPHAYFMLDSQGRKRISFKRGEESSDMMPPEAFELTKKEAAGDDLSMQNLREMHINVAYYDETTESLNYDKDLSGLKVKLIGQYETISGAVSAAENNVYGFTSELVVKMPEDQDFTVVLDSDEYVSRVFPVTQKFHPEFANWGMKDFMYSTYDHRSCNDAVIYVSKKEVGPVDLELGMSGDPTPIEDEKFMSENGNVYIRNMNAHRYEDDYPEFVINSRVLDDFKVDSLEGRKYMVMDVDAVNLWRDELCKFSAGDFEYTATIPDGKPVENVYYIDDEGKLCELEFVQEGSNVTYRMETLSRFNNVFVFAKDAEEIEEILSGLPEEITGADAEAVKEARDAFDRLPDEEKAAHPELAQKIKDAETQLEMYSLKSDKEAAENKAAAVVRLSVDVVEACVLNTSGYTKSTAAGFKAALDKAIEVLKDSSSDTAAINEAADKLESAQSALVAKSKNGMTVKSSAKSVKASKVKKAKKTVAPIKVKGANGKVTYSKVSGSKKLTVNKKTGKITVKKGTKKGKLKIQVKVTAAGDDNHKAASKTVKVTITVK